MKGAKSVLMGNFDIFRLDRAKLRKDAEKILQNALIVIKPLCSTFAGFLSDIRVNLHHS